jgi:ArsR family transcriptional regulator, arsenate/arsenite/antimonite-responsive transcriptional repressor
LLWLRYFFDKHLTEQFGILEQELAHFTRAIGHPARVAVLIAIAKNGNMVEGDIIDVPPLSKSTIIQHLRELKRAGLIDGKIFGVKSKYWINKEVLLKFQSDMLTFFSEIGVENPC